MMFERLWRTYSSIHKMS
ncbi:hypothetical protein Patl1_13807 [Pistacia atlantica]|uniref:Uncharacterized protein n=1 Tax=Pistacia atlantica TaxID=434234 RepID=A0ACC1AV20_9ROSI|nr:hypothetical protein Patl1_13807 [Pistacia atlantica]